MRGKLLTVTLLAALIGLAGCKRTAADGATAAATAGNAAPEVALSDRLFAPRVCMLTPGL